MGRASRKRPKHLVKKLRQIRKSLGLTQTQMLIKLGYSADKKEFRSIISAYELGKREPDLIDLLNYSKLGSVSVETLIDDSIELDCH